MMTVFRTTSEPFELRLAAFDAIMNTLPGYVTLQLLAHSLRTEPSSQMKTYVYTTLVNIASYKVLSPEFQEM